MTLGERIKYYRTNKGLSQEKLAECINVSRQAITKWERNGGVPELNNLIALSNLFEVSIDTLIGNTEGSSIKPQSPSTQISITPKYYDVELSGWNDGEFNVLLVNEDNRFLYFLKNKKGNVLGIAINKKYVANITALNKNVPSDPETEKIDKAYFNGKVVNIDLKKKEGILAGFLDFRDDDYRGCKIENIDDSQIFLEWGRSLKSDEVTKIAEI